MSRNAATKITLDKVLDEILDILRNRGTCCEFCRFCIDRHEVSTVREAGKGFIKLLLLSGNKIKDIIRSVSSLSQIIKKPRFFDLGSLIMAEWTGFEPATPCVTGRYSNQLNYHSEIRIATLNSFVK